MGSDRFMTTTIKTDDPRELLALVPYQLGFWPQESIVVVSLRRGGRAGLVVRADLADLADPEHGPRMARSLVGHVLDDGATQAVVVAFADGREDEIRTAVRHWSAAAEHELGEPETWVVCATGYYGLDCTDTSCCPPGGRPTAELQGTQVSAQMVLDGVQVAAGRADLARIAQVSAAARKSARRARSRWAARSGGPGPMAGHPWRRAGLELWRAEVARVGGDTVQPSGTGVTMRPATVSSAPTAGRLQAALDDVLVRDAVLLTLVPGADRLADRVVAGDTGADVGRALDVMLDPVRGALPDPAVVEPAGAVLEQLVAHDTRAGHAPALTLLGLLAWWTGDGARAGALVERALAARPDYRLAVLLDDALTVGLPPGWARAERGPAEADRMIR